MPNKHSNFYAVIQSHAARRARRTMMVRSPKSDAITRDNSEYMKSELQCNKCKVVVNELLAFVSHKVDTLPEPAIIQICMSAYSYDEIETARSIALKLLAPTKKFMRRKDGSEQKSLQEVIKLIKEFQPDCLPAFVAMNLNKIPAVSFDYVDVTVFLKEMAVLRRDVANMKANKNDCDNMDRTSDIDCLKTELEELKVMLRELRSCTEQSSSKRTHPISTENRPEKDQKCDEITISCSPAPRVANAGDKDSKNKRGQSKRKNMPTPTADALISGLRRSRTRSPAPRTDNIHTPLYRDIAVCASSQQAKHNRAPLDPRNNESFILVERKKRKRLSNFSGTALGSGKLQIAELTSAVYVSRLNKATTNDDILDYIREMGQECKNVESLPQKHETDFTSFKVNVPRHSLEVFLNEGFWPKGVKFRLYREYTAKGRMNNFNKYA